MSTKTTFKRVALVAVAALGLGVLSVAPSSAAPIITTTTAYDTTTTANVALGTLPTGTVTLAGGIKTYTYYVLTGCQLPI